jgi:hypothetical protein
MSFILGQREYLEGLPGAIIFGPHLKYTYIPKENSGNTFYLNVDQSLTQSHIGGIFMGQDRHTTPLSISLLIKVSTKIIIGGDLMSNYQ